MKTKKTLSKRFLISIITFLIIVFFSTIVVFSVSIINNKKQNNIFQTEKIANKQKDSPNYNKNNLILQQATEKNDWANSLTNSLKKFSNYDEYEKLKNIQQNNYEVQFQRKVNKDIQITLNLKTTWYSKKSESVLGKIGDLFTGGSHNVVINDNSIENHWSSINIADYSNEISKKFKEQNNLYLLIPNSSIKKGTSYVKKDTLGNIYRYWYEGKVQVSYYKGSKFFNQQYSKSLFAKKIFMSPYILKNKKFTSNELKQLISLKDFKGNLISNPSSKINSISLDRKNKKLIVSLNKIAIDGEKVSKPSDDFIDLRNKQGHWYLPQTIEVPIKTINFDYALEASKLSASYWEHQGNGETKYYSEKPLTKARFSESWIKALFFYTHLQDVKQQIDNMANQFVGKKGGSDYSLAIQKANSFALNIQNIEKVLNLYKFNRKRSILLNLKAPQDILKYNKANNFNNVNFNDYLYILKNSVFSITHGSLVFKHEAYNIEKALNGIYFKLSEEDIRKGDQYSTNWKLYLKNMFLSSSKNNIVLKNNILKFDIPNENLNIYDLKLKYTDATEEAIEHSYLYQAKGIDISSNISFHMEDGTILDQDYKVIQAAKISRLKKGDPGYVSIRYKATLKDNTQEYIVIIKKNGQWYSPKYQEYLANLLNTKNPFDLKKVEYLFNQALDLVVNPYSKTISQDLDPNKLPNNITAKPLEYKVDGIYKGNVSPQLPQGASSKIYSYYINGITSDLNFPLPSGLKSENIYSSNQTFSKEEYDLLPSNLKSKFKSSWNISGTTNNIFNNAPKKIKGISISPIGNPNSIVASDSHSESGTEEGISWYRYAIGHMSMTLFHKRWLSNNNGTDWKYKEEYAESDGQMDLNWYIDNNWYNSYYTDYTTTKNATKDGSNIIRNLKWNSNWKELKFNFETVGGKVNANPINSYRSSPSFTLKKEDANNDNKVNIYLNGSYKTYFYLNNNLNEHTYKLSTQYNNDFGVILYWDSNGINLKLHVDSNETDNWTYIMLLRNIEIIKKTKYSYSGIYQGQNLPSLPAGITAKLYECQTNQTFTKLEYASLPNNLKSKFHISQHKITGTYIGNSKPYLPPGINASINAYKVTGTVASSTNPILPSGIHAKPSKWELKSKGSATPLKMIDLAGKPQYGIKSVIDTHNGNKKTLEDWNDNKWSHTHNNKGIALFDGVFGTDMNGRYDSYGRLGEGLHNIKINLQNAYVTSIKKEFTIYIDKNPVKIKVTSSGQIKKLQIKEDANTTQELYFSNKPITFNITDIDIKSIDTQFIDSSGNWYELPINIKSKLVNNKWKQVIYSTIDYAGFAKIFIKDQAGNSKKVYFWLKQNSKDEKPYFEYDKQSFIKNITHNEFASDLLVLKEKASIKFSSPLIMPSYIDNKTKETIEPIDIEHLELKKGQWVINPSKNNYTIKDYQLTTSSNYKWGKTIDSSSSTLKYAGDELKPFLNNNSKSKWNVFNKIITFNKPGLYKISLATRFARNSLFEYWIYVNKNGTTEPIDISNFKNELSNFTNLPKKDQGVLKKIDSQNKSTKELFIDFPNFLIKDMKIYYSLPWYSEFTKLETKEKHLTKEGKYKVELTDIFNNKYNYQFLVLNQDLDNQTRESLSKMPLWYVDKSKTQTDLTRPFWKGSNKFNYYRYEDEDHIKYEHDKFIDDAIKHGLTKEQAEWLFKHLKENPNWDGKLDWKGKDWKNEYKKMGGPDHPGSENKNKQEQPEWNYHNPKNPNNSSEYQKVNSKDKGLSSKQKGIIAGIVIGSSSGGLLLIYFIRNRLRTRKIK